MVSNRNAMHLFLYRSDQLKHAGICRNSNLLPLRRYDRAGAVPVILHHAEHRNGNAGLRKQAGDRIRLPAPAVKQNQIWQRGKLLIPVLIAPDAPRTAY